MSDQSNTRKISLRYCKWESGDIFVGNTVLNLWLYFDQKTAVSHSHTHSTNSIATLPLQHVADKARKCLINSELHLIFNFFVIRFLYEEEHFVFVFVYWHELSIFLSIFLSTSWQPRFITVFYQRRKCSRIFFT